ARPSGDDLEALANAVREAARPPERPAAPERTETRETPQPGATRRGHLRVLRSPDS
ncbi:DUF3499 family protein, partial [Streptomyces benahoarensis]